MYSFPPNNSGSTKKESIESLDRLQKGLQDFRYNASMQTLIAETKRKLFYSIYLFESYKYKNT